MEKDFLFNTKDLDLKDSLKINSGLLQILIAMIHKLYIFDLIIFSIMTISLLLSFFILAKINIEIISLLVMVLYLIIFYKTGGMVLLYISILLASNILKVFNLNYINNDDNYDISHSKYLSRDKILETNKEFISSIMKYIKSLRRNNGVNN